MGRSYLLFQTASPKALLTRHFSAYLCVTFQAQLEASLWWLPLRFAGFCRVLGIIFTLWILFFNAKWNNTRYSGDQIGFAHPLLIFLWNFSFPQVPWLGKKKKFLEQQNSLKSYAYVLNFLPLDKSPDPERFILKLINNLHPFSYTSLLHSNYIFKKGENKFDCYSFLWDEAGLTWAIKKLPLPFSILFPKIFINVSSWIYVAWFDWILKGRGVGNTELLIYDSVWGYSEHAEVQADPGCGAEHHPTGLSEKWIWLLVTIVREAT